MDWISSLLLATVRLAIPVLLISLAELYGQRAGMVNIGLEGLASIGALVGFLVCYVTGSNWLGLLCGALAGVIVNMIYAFSTVTLCAVLAPSLKNCSATSGAISYIIMLKKQQSSPPSQNDGCDMDTGEPGTMKQSSAFSPGTSCALSTGTSTHSRDDDSELAKNSCAEGLSHEWEKRNTWSPIEGPSKAPQSEGKYERRKASCA